MRPPTVTIRLRCGLPIVVDGGITRWRISAIPQGKNGSHLVIGCDCIGDPARSINLAIGRRRDVSTTGPFDAERGTVLALIFAKLVREGRAEWVNRFAET